MARLVATWLGEYLMVSCICLAVSLKRSRHASAFRAVRLTADPNLAHRIIADAMPPLLASVCSAKEFEGMRQRLNQMPEAPARPGLTKEEWLGGAGVFLAVFLSTFPAVTPFLFISDARRAVRISNEVAIVMLFLIGYAFGRYAGYRP